MSGPAPIPFLWDGESMVPLPKFALKCDEQYVAGETYRLVPAGETSNATRGHYFASLNEAWKNIPENLQHEFPTMEHLRKRALIEAGYRTTREIVCASQAEAIKVAAFIQPIDEFAVVSVSGNVVIHMVAKSQSQAAMKKGEFQQSKDAVLRIVASLIGTDPATLSANAGKAA